MYAKVIVLIAMAAVAMAEPNPNPEPNPGYFNKYGNYVPTVEDYAVPAPFYNPHYNPALAYNPYAAYNPYVDYAYAPYPVVARSYY